MEEQIVSFETAKLLASKGFDAYSEDYYLNESGRFETSLSGVWKNKSITKAYRQSLAQKWLREIHNIHIYIKPIWGSKQEADDPNAKPESYCPCVTAEQIAEDEPDEYFDTYEQALEAAILDALKDIKTN